MNTNKPMSVLLIEDDPLELNAYKDYITTLEDVKLVGSTNSSSQGIHLVKSYLPDVVILDLELNQGTGSGIEFLTEMRNTKISVNPCIIVITNNPSQLVHDHIREYGVDFIFYKKKTDYSAQKVIATIMMLRPSFELKRNTALPNNIATTETPHEVEQRICARISKELDLIGISPKVIGKKYLIEGIYTLIQEKDTDLTCSIYRKIAKKSNKTENSVNRAMSTAITKAWRSCNIEDLEKYYTARVNPQSGIPTVTEFIYYYADKIKKSL